MNEDGCMVVSTGRQGDAMIMILKCVLSHRPDWNINSSDASSSSSFVKLSRASPGWTWTSLAELCATLGCLVVLGISVIMGALIIYKRFIRRKRFDFEELMVPEDENTEKELDEDDHWRDASRLRNNEPLRRAHERYVAKKGKRIMHAIRVTRLQSLVPHGHPLPQPLNSDPAFTSESTSSSVSIPSRLDEKWLEAHLPEHLFIQPWHKSTCMSDECKYDHPMIDVKRGYEGLSKNHVLLCNPCRRSCYKDSVVTESNTDDAAWIKSSRHRENAIRYADIKHRYFIQCENDFRHDSFSYVPRPPPLPSLPRSTTEQEKEE